MDYAPTGFLGAFERRMLWPDEHEGPWLLVFSFLELNQRSECVGFEIRSFVKDVEGQQAPVAPGPIKPLTTTTLRQVSFDSLAQQARKNGSAFVPHSFYNLLSQLGLESAGVEKLLNEAEARATGAADTGRPPGRPKSYEQDHFGEVAEVYLQADRMGLPATRAVQEHFARKWDDEVSRSQAAKWVYRARHEYGFLGKTAPRQQGQTREQDDA